jgi:tetratricopeptide (TPR) repeat protein
MLVSRRTALIGLLILLFAAAAAVAWPVVRFYRARHRLEAAERALQRRDFAEADALLERCLADRPRDPSVLLVAAQSGRRQSDLVRAEQGLTAYKEAGGPPDAVPYRLERRLLRLQRSQEAAWLLPEAEALLLYCTDNPDEPDVYLVLEAVVVTLLRRLEMVTMLGVDPDEGEVRAHSMALRAVEVWEQTRDGEADRTEALVWRGWLLLARRETAKAERLFRQALSRDPDHFAARLALARVIAHSSPREAVEHLRRLARHAPKDHGVRIALATALRGTGQTDEAAAMLDELLAEHPDQFLLLRERGMAAMDQKDYALAERLLRRAVEQSPADPEANHLLAECLRNAGKPDEAGRFRRRSEELRAEHERKAAPK